MFLLLNILFSLISQKSLFFKFNKFIKISFNVNYFEQTFSGTWFPSSILKLKFNVTSENFSCIILLYMFVLLPCNVFHLWSCFFRDTPYLFCIWIVIFQVLYFFLSSSPFSMFVTIFSAVSVLLLRPTAPSFPYYDFGFPSTSLLIITLFCIFNLWPSFSEAIALWSFLLFMVKLLVWIFTCSVILINVFLIM